MVHDEEGRQLLVILRGGRRPFRAIQAVRYAPKCCDRSSVTQIVHGLHARHRQAQMCDVSDETATDALDVNYDRAANPRCAWGDVQEERASAHELFD